MLRRDGGPATPVPYGGKYRIMRFGVATLNLARSAMPANRRVF
jgi:hypothetical protein